MYITSSISTNFVYAATFFTRISLIIRARYLIEWAVFFAPDPSAVHGGLAPRSAVTQPHRRERTSAFAGQPR